jgi:hypothetical protein
MLPVPRQGVTLPFEGTIIKNVKRHCMSSPMEAGRKGMDPRSSGLWRYGDEEKYFVNIVRLIVNFCRYLTDKYTQMLIN